MNFLLDHQQIDERLVNDRVRPMPLFVQQSAKRIFHRAGRRRENVRLDRRQVNDVLADESPGNVESARENLVEAEKLFRQIANRVADVNPLFAFVEMNVAQVVRLHDIELFILAFAQMRVDDDGTVMARVNQIRIVAVLFHRADDTFHLPRRRRTAGKEKVPRDIYFQRGVGLLINDLLIAGEIHQPMVISENRAWRCFQNCNLAHQFPFVIHRLRRFRRKKLSV